MKLKRNSLTALLVVSFLLMALSGCGQKPSWIQRSRRWKP